MGARVWVLRLAPFLLAAVLVVAGDAAAGCKISTDGAITCDWPA